MLVHICCSVDSHYFLSELQKQYPEEKLIGFFYNPNIHPESEYILRLNDVRRSCTMLGIQLIEEDYEQKKWFNSVRGLEHEPEKGKRCIQCFDMRLEKSAEVAYAMGERRFTTTLLSSPIKEQKILYEQGDIISEKYNLDFIKIDVRKNGGVQKQNELAKKDLLYRQNYCGCQFALQQQRHKQNRISLEMMSELGRRSLPGSTEERMETFASRNALEASNENFILTQRKKRVWRLLQGKVSYNDSIIHSYILAHSESKTAKVGAIVWGQVMLRSLVLQESNLTNIKNLAVAFKVWLGFSKKDDTLFICLKDFNMLVGTEYKSVLELVYHPIDYEKELLLRTQLCGSETTNPIIIIDKPIEENLKIEISSIFQDEKVFQTIALA